MAINDPRPAPGSTVACIPLADLTALHATACELFKLASEINMLDAPAYPHALTQSLRGLALALNNRIVSMPTGVISMPEDPAPTAAHNTGEPA